MFVRDLAIQHYRGVGNCTEETFDDDFYIAQRFLIQIRKDGKEGKKINLPLCINYLITFFNVFEHNAAVKILTSMAGEELPKTNSFLLFLNKIPNLDDTTFDQSVLTSLGKHYTSGFIE